MKAKIIGHGHTINGNQFHQHCFPMLCHDNKVGENPVHPDLPEFAARGVKI
jgi:hypothetical protein